MTGEKKIKKVVLIAGPTAAGKTAAAITVAQLLDTEIISADSRQCYKELSIGVARPTEEELEAVPHHFIASHSITEKVTAGTFEKYALNKANDIFKKKDFVVMVGGTGLYIKAFCEGLDEVPVVSKEIHDEIIKNYTVQGIEWLQEEVRKSDPDFFKKGEVLNPQRLMRALEVKMVTGKSIIEFRTGKKATRDFEIIKIGIDLPKDILHHNINSRVDKMMDMGLLEEVINLQSMQNLNALQTVGYKELFRFLSGEISLPSAIEDIKKNTRQYAKRQLTWFRKDNEIQWMNADAIESYLSTVIK